MMYKATNGHYDSICIFKSKVVLGPRNKRRVEAGLGMTLKEFREGFVRYTGIYFTLRQAKLIHKRIGKIIKELEIKK